MRIGWALALQRNWRTTDAAASVTITSPAPGTTFYEDGPAVTVSGTSTGLVGDTVEASFDGFSTIVGTSGVIGVGGAWLLFAVPLVGDIGETTLEVRDVGGSAALDSIACVVTNLTTLLTTTTTDLDYRAENAVHAGAAFTYVDDVVSAAAADRLVIKTGAPGWSSSHAKFGGMAVVTFAAAEVIGAQTPGSGVTESQPYSILCMVIPPLPTASRNTMLDGYDATHRCDLQVRSSTNWEAETGILQDLGLACDSTKAQLALFEIDSSGAATLVRTYDEDGTEAASGGFNTGTDAFGGLFIGGTYTLANLSTMTLHRALVFQTVLTSGEWTAAKAWALANFSWGP